MKRTSFLIHLLAFLATSLPFSNALIVQKQEIAVIREGFGGKEDNSVSRRQALFAAARVGSFGAAAALMGPSPSLAADASAFEGTYSDPINHPGGKRTIRLLGQSVGDYQLAEVVGGGGRGEPKNYVLPAAIIGDRTIIIDFSPKGGPRDFAGVLEGKNIKFLRDGNTWPRL